jgi:hypothetical protein
VHWVLLDLAIYAISVLLVAALTVTLYRRVRVLTRAVGAASRTVGEVTPGLAVHQPVGK